MKTGSTPRAGALLIGAALGALAGCSSSGDGGATFPRPPLSPPPPPPDALGVSSSGGVIHADGSFDGDFRGPRAETRFSCSPGGCDATSPEAHGNTSPGSADDFLVSVTPVTGPMDAPTVTITFVGDPVGFDFDSPVVRTHGAGQATEEIVTTTFGDHDYKAARWTFDAIDAEYAALYEIYRKSPAPRTPSVNAYATIGADVVDLPSSGSATFDTAVIGEYYAEGLDPAEASIVTDSGTFYARGDVEVDFGAGSVTGSFADVDWLRSGVVDATTARGADFGLTFSAQINGDDFFGVMSAINDTSGALVGEPEPFPSLTGEIAGDFYGPTDAAPEEIGAAFVLGGGPRYAIGGMLGKAR